MGLFDTAGDLVGGVLPDVDVRKLRRVVDLIWDNRDGLVDLLTRLPTLLGDAGEQLHGAGEGAQQAGALLSGDLLALTGSAADALDACQRQLAQVAGVLGEIGNLLDRMPLMGNVTEPVTRGLHAVGEVADNLETVAGQVRGIGTGLRDVGAGLDAMGGSLKGGGTALATLSGRSIATTAKPAGKPAGKAKPAARSTPKPTPKAAPTAPKPKAPKLGSTAAGKLGPKGSAAANGTKAAKGQSAKA